MLRKIMHSADMTKLSELDLYPTLKVAWDELVTEAEAKIAGLKNYNLGKTVLKSNKSSSVITNVRFRNASFKLLGPNRRVQETLGKVDTYVMIIERFGRRPRIITWTVAVNGKGDDITIKDLERITRKDILDLYIVTELADLPIDPSWILSLFHAYLWKESL